MLGQIWAFLTVKQPLLGLGFIQYRHWCMPFKFLTYPDIKLEFGVRKIASSIGHTFHSRVSINYGFLLKLHILSLTKLKLVKLWHHLAVTYSISKVQFFWSGQDLVLLASSL
jgi:hypothetical protein